MNKTGYGNYAKLIAFFLVASLLVVGFGFATEGWWQQENEYDDSRPSDDKPSADAGTEDKLPAVSEPETKLPEFFNLLTGEETTEELSRKRHYAFILDESSPLYGINGSDILAEFPTESGETRILAFTNNTANFKKIGALSKTRHYISNVAKFFGSIIVSNGNDGYIDYEHCDMNGSAFDMSEHFGYCYTEYSQFTYTGADLLSAGLYNANVNTAVPSDISIPFTFIDYGKEIGEGAFSAKSVLLPFSQKSETELYYSQSSECYSFNKNGSPKKDMLSDQKIIYKNVFLLFADSLTYEGAENTEMVMNTIGEGTGYYISCGMGQKITWRSDVSGKMTFFNESGEKLTVNRGSSYFGFMKSAKLEDVKIL